MDKEWDGLYLDFERADDPVAHVALRREAFRTAEWIGEDSAPSSLAHRRVAGRHRHRDRDVIKVEDDIEIDDDSSP